MSRPRSVNPTQPASRPDSILALALRHENQYFGTLWLGYDRPHTFTEEEVRFFVTLASQATIAAANAHLFQSAEVERQRLAAILASSPDPILVTDAQNHLLLANPAALQLLSLGMSVNKGKPIDAVIEQPELLALLRQTGSENDSSEVTLPGGAVYLATASPIHIDGQSIGRVCLLRDVSQFKKLDAMKSEFVATVSHDLRQPLTQMGGYTNLVEAMGPLNDSQTTYMGKIKLAVERMTGMVNDLLHQGRIEAGAELQITMTPIQDLLEKVISEAQPDATQRKIELSLEIEPGNAPLMEADSSLLERALQNLVGNAIKYTQPRLAEGRPGQVRVKVRTVGEEMIFDVNDNGMGISPVDIPRLFEKFYRGAQGSGREQRGMGMGLAIVKGVAERHGGTVKVNSTLGSGSTFTMTLPLRQPQRQLSRQPLHQPARPETMPDVPPER
jgi:signal transduction histidine kinase